jgi:hypothetical protein
MQPFITQISGFTVTNENYIEVAKQISDLYGVCPALNNLILKVVQHDDTIECSRKGLKKAIDKYTILIGYKPAYFAAQMRKFDNPNY